MKSLELQPTYENILNSFDRDILGRSIDVLRFTELLNSIDGSFSIALDAQWGSGKTFFIKQTKLVLDAFNAHIDNPNAKDNERIYQIRDRIKLQSKSDLQPQISVYYDAWANDNDEDPILSLVYSILQSVSVDFSFSTDPVFLKIAANIADLITGKSYVALYEALQGQNALEHIRATKNLEAQITEFLDSLLAERGNRLIIFVDELDRCNPAYAVKLLERIKHYFNNDRITFVFSVNIAELQHTVRNHYGEGFNATRYLDRFFDLRVDLPPAKMERFYMEIGLNHDSYVYEKVCKTVIEQNHFSLREIVKFYHMTKIAAYEPMHDTQYSFAFSAGNTTLFCLMFLVPIMAGLKISDYPRYEAFIAGKDSSPLHDFFLNTEVGTNIRNNLLAPNECFDPTGNQRGMIVVKLEDKLNILYNALFVQQYTSRVYEIQIGKMSFDSQSKDTLLQAVSILSNFSNYDV